MSLKAIAGGVGGGFLGAAGGAALGAVNGAVETVSLRSVKTEVGKDGEIKETRKMPGIIKTALWGAAAAGATALFALNPTSWPVVGLLAAKAGLVGPAAGFVAGATARAVKNVVMGGFVGGIIGGGLGGAGGAILGSKLD